MNLPYSPDNLGKWEHQLDELLLRKRAIDVAAIKDQVNEAVTDVSIARRNIVKNGMMVLADALNVERQPYFSGLKPLNELSNIYCGMRGLRTVIERTLTIHTGHEALTTLLVGVRGQMETFVRELQEHLNDTALRRIVSDDADDDEGGDYLEEL
jgi:hypothetical protein